MAILDKHPVRSPIQLESVGGAVPLDSAFYVSRAADTLFFGALDKHESAIILKGGRQVGKTSLLARGLQHVRAAGAKVILTDLQKFNAQELQSLEAFLLTLAGQIADRLDLPSNPEDSWNPENSPQENFEQFFKEQALAAISSRLVWGLDEVDRLFATAFRSQFFELLQKWRSESHLRSSLFSRLTIILSYATEASLFSEDLKNDPLQVKTRLTLEDFTSDQVEDLNRRHGSPLRSAQDLIRFYRLLSGQPFLVRRALHEMVVHHLTIDQLETQGNVDDGIFGDHLRRILLLLGQDKLFSELVRQVVTQFPTDLTLDSFCRLKSAGLVTGNSLSEARPRCQLYVNYLSQRLGSA